MNLGRILTLEMFNQDPDCLRIRFASVRQVPNGACARQTSRIQLSDERYLSRLQKLLVRLDRLPPLPAHLEVRRIRLKLLERVT
jgi:hypothetical protein